MVQQSGDLMPEDRIRIPRRRLIEIDNMSRSLSAILPVHAFNTARAENFVIAVDKLKAENFSNGVTALLFYVLTKALELHPEMHRTIDGEEFIINSDINIGVAVSGPDGSLSVPVLHGAQQFNIREMALKLEELAARSRAQKLSSSDVKGGSFALSNMGKTMKGGQGAGILPFGYSGMIASGSVIDVPVVDNGQVVPGKVLPLTLTFDHRVVNGIAAWKFYADVVKGIEEIVV